MTLFIITAFITGCAGEKTSELDRSRQLLSAGDFRSAQVSAESYIAGHPKGPQLAEAYYVKGRAIEDQVVATQEEGRSNLQAARTAYIAALDAKPSTPALNGLIRAALSDVAYWQQDYKTAAEQGATAAPLLTDPSTRSWTAYRAGMAYQRMGQFEEADKLLREVVSNYPDTEPAQRAHARIGVRGFHVQIATFAQPAAADQAATALQRQGFKAIKQTQSGKTVLLVGPFPTYGQATAAKSKLVGTYPEALLTP
ncbi:MAG TPA: SPOR domain-containing protein [Tepidisphaeraceae bacterium]